MKSKFVDDLSGTQIGKITVISVATKGSPGIHATYNCECQCGRKLKTRSTSLRQAVSQDNKDYSCGRCLAFITGSSATAKLLYNVWLSMIYRCYRVPKDDPMYNNYRGKGIKVCKSWYADVMVFAEWALSNGYAKGLQLDRVDNDRGYRPSNCRFTTPTINNRNRACTNFVMFRGKKVPLAELTKKYAVVSHTLVINRFYKMGWSLMTAMTTPARSYS